MRVDDSKLGELRTGMGRIEDFFLHQKDSQEQIANILEVMSSKLDKSFNI